jgi:hypothetical protein
VPYYQIAREGIRLLPGCWKITAKIDDVHDSELTFALQVRYPIGYSIGIITAHRPGCGTKALGKIFLVGKIPIELINPIERVLSSNACCQHLQLILLESWLRKTVYMESDSILSRPHSASLSGFHAR